MVFDQSILKLCIDVTVLTLILQRAFQGKTTLKDKILQILFSNILVPTSVIQADH